MLEIVPKELIISLTQKAIGKALLFWANHGSTVEVGVGLVAGISSTILACKATLAASDKLKTSQTEVKLLKSKTAILKEGYSEEPESDNLTSEIDLEYKKELSILYLKRVAALAKEYALPITLTVLSSGLIIHSHISLKNQNAGLVAAYNILQAGFASYQKAVKEKYGAEEDVLIRKMSAGERAELLGKREEELTKALSEDPSINVVKKLIDMNWDDNLDLRRVFSKRNSTRWCDDHFTNRFMLMQTQNYLNDQLRARRHLFLNEVYRELGFDETNEGAVLGWTWDHAMTEVDLGLNDEENSRFMCGLATDPVINFNINGVILGRI